MALQVTYTDPFGTTDLTNAYARVIFMALDFADQHGRIVIGIYKDQAARDANKKPIATAAIDLTKNGTPAKKDGESLVKDGDDWKDSNDNVVTPDIPEVPAFNSLVGGIMTPGAVVPVFGVIQTFIYNMVVAQKILTGSPTPV